MAQAAHILRTLRPRQWTKNLFVFAGILFSQNLCDPVMLAKAIGAFVAFCALSGAVYAINDVADLEEDRSHPIKRARPVASGRLKVSSALRLAIFLALAALAGSYLLRSGFFEVAIAYFTLQLAYTFLLKRVVILDVFAIAAGFVLRVVGGAVVIDVRISSWLIICTILLSLFLGFCKRRHELVMVGDNSGNQRKVLSEYSPHLLDQMIAVVTASTLIAYTLYTMSQVTIAKFGTENLIFTIPFVLYGIFRYLYLVHQKGKGGSPERTLLNDLPLVVDLLLWVGTVALILYTG